MMNSSRVQNTLHARSIPLASPSSSAVTAAIPQSSDPDPGSATPEPVISIRDVDFAYHRHRLILKQVDLDVPAGQSLGILGSNGAGKTTLFSIIIGLVRPQHGQAIINANLVPTMRDVFVLSDSNNLNPGLTILENLRFRSMLYATHDNPHPIDMDMTHLKQQPMIRAFELQNRLNTKVSELSSGFGKRAGIAVGMLFNPNVIMLDEPTNSVDPPTRQLLINMMQQLHAAGRTILTITHDLDYCWKVTDRIIVIDQHRIVADHNIAEFSDFTAFAQTAAPDLQRVTVDFGLKPDHQQADQRQVQR